MKPADADVIVQGKRGLCGFASTNLRFILSQNRIENVVLAGFLVRQWPQRQQAYAVNITHHIWGDGA
jgi:hypothetical protein